MMRAPATRRQMLFGSACSLSALAVGLSPALAGADASMEAVARLCDIVLPDTDTPGARAAGVPDFLPKALSHGLFGGGADTLASLLGYLDGQAGAGGFLGAGAARQLAIVAALDGATFRHPPPPPVPLPAQGSTKPPLSVSAPTDDRAQRLWRIVKSGIVTSFYTSESGGSRTLAYELVPGRYDPSILLGAEPYLSNFWIENIF